ncbi:MAG: hypothetical protein K8R90_02315 [Candidatus Cloacimonetes bacterium]|nr:hypothetical protein [Candidatus Cloacimonadota bacterium]
MRNRWLPYIIVIGALFVIGAFAFMRQMSDDTPRPPFSQEELAATIALAISQSDADLFEATLFDLDDLDDYVALASAKADSAELLRLRSFAVAQHADWPLYLEQMRAQFAQVVADAHRADARKLSVEGLTANMRRLDPATGRVIFGNFDIFLSDGDTRYTLETAMLRQTADGWKLSGDALRLYKDAP